MCWPIPSSKLPSKKTKTAPPGGGDRVPAGERRALGRRRAPRWLGTDPAYGLPSAPSANVGQHPSFRGRPRRLRAPGGGQPDQADRPRLGPRGLACERQAACALASPHVHLLCLPPYSPELQPAEHLWPLTNTALANRHFASIDELEDAQAARCVALQARPDLIRSTTLRSGDFDVFPQALGGCGREGPGTHDFLVRPVHL